MFNFIKEHRHYFLIALIVVIPLLTLGISGKAQQELYWHERILLRIIYPVQTVFSWSIQSVNKGVQNYLFILKTKENNISLQKEVQKLLAEIASYKEMANENERLKKLMDFSQSVIGKKVMAQVIARDIYEEFYSLRLNKGGSHGVKTGMAVVNSDGIIGRIVRVHPNYSDSITLLNHSFSISGIVQESRSMGIIQGYKNNLLQIKYLGRTDEVHVGNTIISSGIGNIFPKGLPIGTVKEVKKEKYGITQEVIVQPNVNFSSLEEVVIVQPKRIPSKTKMAVEENSI